MRRFSAAPGRTMMPLVAPILAPPPDQAAAGVQP